MEDKLLESSQAVHPFSADEMALSMSKMEKWNLVKGTIFSKKGR